MLLHTFEAISSPFYTSSDNVKNMQFVSILRYCGSTSDNVQIIKNVASTIGWEQQLH